MNLDDFQLIKVLDSARMIDIIHSQPEQVKIAREMGKQLSLSLNLHR